MDTACEKMVLAVLSGSDSAEVVHALNEHGFYATMLASTGGFLQKKKRHPDDRPSGCAFG